MGKMDEAYGTTAEGLEAPRHDHGNNAEDEDKCGICNGDDLEVLERPTPFDMQDFSDTLELSDMERMAQSLRNLREIDGICAKHGVATPPIAGKLMERNFPANIITTIDFHRTMWRGVTDEGTLNKILERLRMQGELAILQIDKFNAGEDYSSVAVLNAYQAGEGRINR